MICLYGKRKRFAGDVGSQLIVTSRHVLTRMQEAASLGRNGQSFFARSHQSASLVCFSQTRVQTVTRTAAIQNVRRPSVLLPRPVALPPARTPVQPRQQVAQEDLAVEVSIGCRRMVDGAHHGRHASGTRHAFAAHSIEDLVSMPDCTCYCAHALSVPARLSTW